MRWDLKFTFCPSSCFFLLPLELIDKLQNCHRGDIVLSTSLVLSVADSLLNGKLLKYCLGQFLIWTQFTETINSFFWSLFCCCFFFGTCLTTATLFLSFNMYFYQILGWYLSVLEVIQNFSLCYIGTKASCLPWKFINLDWFLQMVGPIFLTYLTKQTVSTPKPPSSVLSSVCGDNFPNVTQLLLRHCRHLELWLWGGQSSFSGKDLNGFFHLARMKNNSNIQGL